MNPLLGAQSPTQPYQSTLNSINTNPITGANIIATNDTEYGIVTDNNAVLGAVKYIWDPRSSCAGTLNEFSLYADHHFTKRFDVFAGIAYSDVSGGLGIAIPHGPGVPYYHNNNTAPTIGGRFSF